MAEPMKIPTKVHALDIAAETFRGRPPDEIVQAAAAFEKFLDEPVVTAEVMDDAEAGTFDEGIERGVRAWINQRGANAERAARIVAVNDQASMLRALEGEWGILGAVRLLLELVRDPRERAELAARAAGAECSRWSISGHVPNGFALVPPSKEETEECRSPFTPMPGRDVLVVVPERF